MGLDLYGFVEDSDGIPWAFWDGRGKIFTFGININRRGGLSLIIGREIDSSQRIGGSGGEVRKLPGYPGSAQRVRRV